MTDIIQVNDTTPPEASPTLEQQYEKQKAEGLHPEPPQDDRPSWLPEKFKSPEDMAKAYAELEQKQGQPKDDKQPDDTPEPTPESQDDTPKSPVEVAIAKASGEFEKTGDISKETVDELTNMGIDKAYIERYVEMAKEADKRAADRNQGQTGLSQDFIAEVMGLAGGEGGYAEMLDWMQDSLDASEVDAYNATMDSQNPDMIRSTVAGYAARYQVANPSAPKHLQGSTGRGPDVVPFQSVAQVQEAMSNPKYHKDPAYRSEVTRRIAVSKVL